METARELREETGYEATSWEFVGSYFAVDVDDEQRALEIARSYPGVRYGGGLEVWPLMERGGGDL